MSHVFNLDDYQEMNDNYEGGCIDCGETQGECEPDATEYTCESCGKNSVYGAQELLFMGLFE